MKTNPMLTTIDNPYSPHTDFDQWLQYDISHGYNSCGLVSRFALTSEDFDDAHNQEIINNAIEEIVVNDATGLFIKVYK